jgi:protein-S-isoprenylcysteine O-methyltransferase Ste14
MLLLAVLFTAPRMESPYGALSPLVSVLGIFVMGIGFLALAIGLISLGKALTASPIPNEQGQLQTGGIYSLVRHPIYFGLLTLGLGVVLDAGYWPQIVILVMLYVLLRIKSDFEESLLRQKYPDYAAYAAKTPKFFPRLSK